MMEFFRGCGALTLVMAYKCETKSFAMISLWPIDRSTAANEQYRRFTIQTNVMICIQDFCMWS